MWRKRSCERHFQHAPDHHKGNKNRRRSGPYAISAQPSAVLLSVRYFMGGSSKKGVSSLWASYLVACIVVGILTAAALYVLNPSFIQVRVSKQMLTQEFKRRIAQSDSSEPDSTTSSSGTNGDEVLVEENPSLGRIAIVAVVVTGIALLAPLIAPTVATATKVVSVMRGKSSSLGLGGGDGGPFESMSMLAGGPSPAAFH
jgi:hypothetical protein